MSGKGISDAVRGVVHLWMDKETRAAIEQEARNRGITVYDYQLTDAKNWAREKRLSTPTGFIRPYRNNAVPVDLGLVLEVRSNPQDTEIQYFGVRVTGRNSTPKFITGGDCRVASVLVTGKQPNAARLGTSVIDTSEKPSGFKRLTARQLEKINVRAEFGDGLDQLFEGRD